MTITTAVILGAALLVFVWPSVIDLVRDVLDERRADKRELAHRAAVHHDYGEGLISHDQARAALGYGQVYEAPSPALPTPDTLLCSVQINNPRPERAGENVGRALRRFRPGNGAWWGDRP